MRLPRARGPLSRYLLTVLTGPVRRGSGLEEAAAAAVGASDSVLSDEDVQLGLLLLQELGSDGLDGVDDHWERSPDMVSARAVLEDAVEAELRAAVALSVRRALPDARRDVARTLFALTEGSEGPSLAGYVQRRASREQLHEFLIHRSVYHLREADPLEVAAGLHAVVAADDGPSLSGYLRGRATHEQFREFVMHRAVYHLREADPHTWAIPRLAGAAKAALIEIQIDEYGGGVTAKMHQELFKRTMSWFDLDLTYGAYVDSAGAATLATNNLMSWFGLHRRNRGALLGHLAAYEMTSSLPNRGYGNGLRRLGGDTDATAFYDEHVEADAVHEQIAAHDLCGAFARAEPELAGDVLYGARCALALDARWAGGLLTAWDEGRSSLRT